MFEFVFWSCVIGFSPLAIDIVLQLAALARGNGKFAERPARRAIPCSGGATPGHSGAWPIPRL